VTVERYVVNEYEPAGKAVLVAGLLGPPDILPEVLPLPPLLLPLCASWSALVFIGKKGFIRRTLMSTP
jgi:hypothetical protein